MDWSIPKVVAISGAGGLLLLCAVVALLMAVVGMLEDALGIPSPDEIDVEPLNEIVDGLDVLKPPTNHCPESADQCWANVVVASGETRDTTASIVAANAAQAGFSEVEGFNGPWNAQRGNWCVSMYELSLYSTAEFPDDALDVRLDSC